MSDDSFLVCKNNTLANIYCFILISERKFLQYKAAVQLLPLTFDN